MGSSDQRKPAYQIIEQIGPARATRVGRLVGLCTTRGDGQVPLSKDEGELDAHGTLLEGREGQHLDRLDDAGPGRRAVEVALEADRLHRAVGLDPDLRAG